MWSFPDDACGQDLTAPVSVEHRVGFGNRLEREPMRFGYGCDRFFHVPKAGPEGCEPPVGEATAIVVAAADPPIGAAAARS